MSDILELQNQIVLSPKNYYAQRKLAEKKLEYEYLRMRAENTAASMHTDEAVAIAKATFEEAKALVDVPCPQELLEREEAEAEQNQKLQHIRREHRELDTLLRKKHPAFVLALHAHYTASAKLGTNPSAWKKACVKASYVLYMKVCLDFLKN